MKRDDKIPNYKFALNDPDWILMKASLAVPFNSPEEKFIGRARKHIQKETTDADVRAILRESDSLWHRLVEHWKH